MNTSHQLGFTKDMYVMPFDHRGSFAEKLFGIKGRAPTAAETQEIASYKNVIYKGFLKAIAAGVPKEKAGILVDEQFGSAVIKDAKKNGYLTAVPAEKSGQDEFDFEYGDSFGEHIHQFDVDFVKVLVRFNPTWEAALNERQLGRLLKLSQFCQNQKRKLMFELLLPATPAQLAQVGGDQSKFDKELRPALVIQAMQDIQNYGVEPDIWKLEGVEDSETMKKIAAVATNAPHRKNVGVILLGRGENAEKVKTWLKAAAGVPGLVGFAVGRTIFWEPLKSLKDGRISEEQAAEQVAQNYKGFCDLWTQAKTNSSR